MYILTRYKQLLMKAEIKYIVEKIPKPPFVYKEWSALTSKLGRSLSTHNHRLFSAFTLFNK